MLRIPGYPRTTIERLRRIRVDRHGVDIGDSKVILVQPVANEDSVQPDQERDLTLVGFGGLDDVLTVKGEQREQAQRFLDNHAKLQQPPEGAPDKPPKRAARILEQVREGKLDSAFAELTSCSVT